MNLWQRLRRISLLSFVCLLLVACGSASEELVLVSGFASEDPANIVWGFAFEGGGASSPGPTIRVRKGETVTITFKNATFFMDGSPNYDRHNFVVVADKDANSSDMELMWGARVGGMEDEAIKAGESGSVTFIAEDAGSFFYVCTAYGHFAHGMWGLFIVEE